MAAYAAVVSLMNTMDAVMNDPRLSTCFDKKQIQYLGENLDILLQFIENYNYNSLGRDEAQSLERRITSATHMAEDVIESHIVAQINAGVLEDAPTSCIDLHQIMHDIDEIKEEVVKVAEKMGSSNLQKPKNSPQPRQTAGKMTMIGFDDYLIQLLDGLTGSESGRQVIPVVGMGGAGKTTLTKNAYEHLITVQRFDVRAWVSISQQYDVKDILVQLLSSLGQSDDEKNELGELSECLYKYLYGRRYLIVLDDMWSITAWDKIKSCFPERSDSSPIIVTTRLLEVANAFGSSSTVRVGLLDDDKSWDLFCDKAFAQQICPDELEDIGKAIVKKCKGLPLTIVVIGALLGKSSQAREHWENVAKNMSSILSSSDDSLDILCLSYNHLPVHLKPCFLYLGVFDEDIQIRVSELIKLWIAEGFIKPNKDPMLEEVAEGYLEDMLERNLILVDSFGWNKKFETFRIHDLVRDLCLREAKKEKFYSFISGFDKDQEGRCVLYHERPVPFFEDAKFYFKTPFARTLICKELKQQVFWSTLMRVCVELNVTLRSGDVVEYFRKLVNMRYMYCTPLSRFGFHTFQLPRSIFLLWNMQTLIVRNSESKLKLKAPIEIWMMRQLRHVEFRSIILPEPPLSNEDDEFVVLHNLQTLRGVTDLSFSEEVCKRITNIKSLGVNDYTDFWKRSCLQNVGCLNKLESLSYNLGEDLHRPFVQKVALPISLKEFSLWNKGEDRRRPFVQNVTLPTSLKELSLWNSLDWDDMRIIGTLPNLQVLKLFHSILFAGRELWKCVEGEFLALKHLEIRCRDLRIWNAESSHFPVLHTLVLEDLRLLDGIPSGIGDVPTLRIVRLRNCDTTTVISAMKMLEEQESLGNGDIQLQLMFSREHEVKKFLEEVEKEEITCTNFYYRVV